jgi:hypothetical protein
MKILFRSKNNEKWRTVESASYGAEAELKHLISGEPSLINISEVAEDAGELVVAIEEFPLEIGSIDILGFTAQGDMAIMECKLANNEDIKRKVIGQVLEYGANLWEMSYEELDEKVEYKTGKKLGDLVQVAVPSPDWDFEIFKQRVSSALKDGLFFLMIVVDVVNEDLSRIIRFINSAGNPAFSLFALEMK